MRSAEIEQKKGTQSIKYLLLILTLPVLLYGCYIAIGGQKTGRVQLLLDTAEMSKTIMPTIEVDSYAITFFGGPVPQDALETSEANPVIELAVGTWDITVEGKDSEGKLVARGSVSGVTVSGGETTAVTVELTALSDASGTIDVTVSWPESEGIDGVDVTVDGAAVDVGTLSMGDPLTWIRYTEQKPSGSYRLRFELNSGTVVRAIVEEAVQVYDNLTSSETITLSEDDFTSAPQAPSSLVAEEGLGELELSWVDNSVVETGYVVERSIGDNLNYMVLDDTLLANTTGYTDVTAVMEQLYYYRVKAVNGFGESWYSDEVQGMVEVPEPGGGGVLSFSAVMVESMRVSWEKGTDNVSAQEELEYKVVMSDSDNISTVEEAETVGDGRQVVADWTQDLAMVEVTGLSPGTLYYFNVLVKDEAGNKAAYVSDSRETFAEGTLSFTITVRSPEDETITFDQTEDVVVAPDSILTVSIAETFDSYKWSLYGIDLSSQTSNSVDIDCQQLWPGVHHLTLFVEKNELLYSETLRFRIEN